uniref:Nucleotide pyrophosphohydrolase n=1 Tax=Klebsiella phage vB_KpnM_Iguana_ER37 TaxID=3076781 RepID=A0AB38Z3E6_9CAUD
MKEAYETLNSMLRPTSLVKYAKHVVDWNSVAASAKGEFTPLEKQWEFVGEELEETIKALSENDRKEVIDGACDLFVVASYAYWLSNNYSLSLTYTPDLKFSPGKALDAFANEDYEEMLKLSTALLFGLDMQLDKNMSSVLESNDSKYPTLSEVQSLHKDLDLLKALEAECTCIEQRNGGRYEGVHFSIVDGNMKEEPRVVFFDKGGKIMKPGTFKKPNIIV